MEQPYNNNAAIYNYSTYALQHEMLSKTEEIALGKRVLKGDRTAVDRLVTCNLKFVVFIANQMEFIHAPIEDIIQEGNLGLIRAAEKFDYRRNVRFISYAVWWIKSAIGRMGNVNAHIVTIPVKSLNSQKTARTIMKAHYEHFGVDMDPKELAEVANIPIGSAEALLITRREAISLNAPAKFESGYARALDVIETFIDPNDDARVTEGRALCAAVIDRAMRGRSERGIDVVKRYYGLYPYTWNYTLDEIGAIWGITRERVRQIRNEEFREFRRKTARVRLLEEGLETVKKAKRDHLVLGRRRGQI